MVIMCQPKFDRTADSTSLFVDEVQKFLSKDDFTILSFNGEDPTGAKNMWENPKSRFFKNLCHFAALGGFLSTIAVEARQNGQLFVWQDDFPWAGSEGINLPSVSMSDDSLLVKDSVLIHKSSFTKKEAREWKERKEKEGVVFMSHNQLYCAKVAESKIDEEGVTTYIQNLGGKFVDGWWQIKFKKFTTLEVKFQDGTWIYREGNQELVLRRYHTIGGQVPQSPNAIMLIVLNYLLTSRNEEDLRGRRAFLSNVFIDPIFVGYSHRLLDRFNGNKCGTLLGGVSAKTLMPVIVKDGNLVAAAKAYEAKGMSVFMHKGAKYIVVEAECAGFARSEEGKTFVAWHADKQAKLTGRNLFSVPTAGEYVDDDED